MARRRPLTVAITGASGYVARRLIDDLCADERVGRVLGFDIAKPRLHGPKYLFDHLDVRDPAIGGRLKGVDILVHLAFVMDPIHDETEMRDINVNGSQNVLKRAAEAGVKKILYASSAVVYGAHRDNPVPLSESSRLRANLDFSYAAHKLEVEYVIEEVRSEFPKTMVTVFRPAIVFGPHVDNTWSHFLETPLVVGVKGFSPPVQFVHEDDVADALRFGVFHDLDGAFNLAAEGWLEASEVLRVIGRRRFDLPESAAFLLADKLWTAGLSEAPAGMLHYVMHPWVMDTSKLTEAGYIAKRSNLEALEAAVALAEGHLRFGHTRLPISSLWAAAGLGAVAAGAVFAGRRRLSA